jgi:hypothetical protein
MTRDFYMLYALKVMTFHAGEQKRKEKFLYNDSDSITPPSTPSSVPSTPRGKSPSPRDFKCVCCGWACW